MPIKIVKGLKDVETKEGFQGRFDVVVSHEDVPGVWIYNGEELMVKINTK